MEVNVLYLPEDQDAAPPLTSSVHPAVAGLARIIIAIIAMVAVAAITAALAGCGGGDEADRPAVPTPTVLCNTSPPVCT